MLTERVVVMMSPEMIEEIERLAPGNRSEFIRDCVTDRIVQSRQVRRKSVAMKVADPVVECSSVEEQRSPKPRVAGSIPATPANVSDRLARFKAEQARLLAEDREKIGRFLGKASLVTLVSLTGLPEARVKRALTMMERDGEVKGDGNVYQRN